MSSSTNRATLKKYFEALDEGEFKIAAEQFTTDVTYVHPPMYGDEITIQGREDLYTYFTQTRGEKLIDHHIERTVSKEESCSVVGYVTKRDGTEPTEYFVSYAEFEGGKINYYIAGLLGMS